MSKTFLREERKRQQNTLHWVWTVRNQKSVVRTLSCRKSQVWRSEVSSRKPEVGNWKLEVGSRKSEVGRPFSAFVLRNRYQFEGTVFFQLETQPCCFDSTRGKNNQNDAKLTRSSPGLLGFISNTKSWKFRYLGKFFLWNTISWALEFGMQLKESGISIGIQNPRGVPLTKTGIQLVPGIRNSRCGIQTDPRLSWIESFRFEDENDYEYEIFSIISSKRA